MRERYVCLSQVLRVLLESGRAVGVEVERFGARQRLLAAREVVLSAGAVGTPHILLLSGIGDTEHLQEVARRQGAGGGVSAGSTTPTSPYYRWVWSRLCTCQEWGGTCRTT